jgi:hypothetical protein
MREIVFLLLVCRDFAETHRSNPLCSLDLDLTPLKTWPSGFGFHVLNKLRDLRWAGHSLAKVDWERGVRSLRQQGPVVLAGHGRWEQGQLVIARAQFCQPWYTVAWQANFPLLCVSNLCSPTFSFAGFGCFLVLEVRRGWVWAKLNGETSALPKFAIQVLGLGADRQLLDTDGLHETVPSYLPFELVSKSSLVRENCRCVRVRLRLMSNSV